VEGGTVIAGTLDHAKMVTLRSAEVLVAANATAEMSIPAAPLSSGAFRRDQTFEFSEASDPALRALLDYCQSHDDLPAITAQLLVLCVAEDVTFAKWREFLAQQRPPGEAAANREAEDVAAAIDALGVLRQLYPRRTFALASDAELKLRALRNPVARLKAMQLYGLSLPEAPLPPDLGSLLHMKPGDNCPICRQRALMQPREDGL
jgi:hypothetical protein